jgi:hypothetical protein
MYESRHLPCAHHSQADENELTFAAVSSRVWSERKQQVAGATPRQKAPCGEQEPEIHAVEHAIVLRVKHGWSPFQKLNSRFKSRSLQRWRLG